VFGVRTAAVTAVALLLAVALFQLALAAGVPWGSAAYGGDAAAADGSLSASLRASSGVAVLILGLAAWIVLARGGVVTAGRLDRRLVLALTWVIVAMMALNTLANATSSSDVERWLMGTVAVALVALCAVVVLHGGESAE
jgi:hypothetical protein